MTNTGVEQKEDGWFVFIEINTEDLNYKLTHPATWYPEIESCLQREVEEIENNLWVKLVRRIIALSKINNL